MHDKLLREADDMVTGTAWKEIEAERAKWSNVLLKQSGDLLPWLLDQSDEVQANSFAFCVAATVDGISGTDRPHAVNHLSNLAQVDMSFYWTPTRERYLDHVSKTRIVEVVSSASSPEAAAPLGAMKKDAAAGAAETRIRDSGWLLEALTNRETPTVHNYDEDEDDLEDRETANEQHDTD